MRPASAGRSLAHGVTYTGVMIRWLLVTFLALMLIGWLSPLLRRLGFGRLPGDLRFRWLGREGQRPLASTLPLRFLGRGVGEWEIPLASLLLLSLLVGGLAKWL